MNNFEQYILAGAGIEPDRIVAERLRLKIGSIASYRRYRGISSPVKAYQARNDSQRVSFTWLKEAKAWVAVSSFDYKNPRFYVGETLKEARAYFNMPEVIPDLYNLEVGKLPFSTLANKLNIKRSTISDIALVSGISFPVANTYSISGGFSESSFYVKHAGVWVVCIFSKEDNVVNLGYSASFEEAQIMAETNPIIGFS